AFLAEIHLGGHALKVVSTMLQYLREPVVQPGKGTAGSGEGVNQNNHSDHGHAKADRAPTRLQQDDDGHDSDPDIHFVPETRARKDVVEVVDQIEARIAGGG